MAWVHMACTQAFLFIFAACFDSSMAPKRKPASEAGIVSDNGDGFRARIFMNWSYTSGPRHHEVHQQQGDACTRPMGLLREKTGKFAAASRSRTCLADGTCRSRRASSTMREAWSADM